MRRAWHSFGFEMTWTIEHEHRLQVSGKVLPGCAAVTNCLPENATPGEDDELDDVYIEVIRGAKKRALSTDAVFNLMDNPAFVNKVESMLEDLEVCTAEEYD
jgi:hypothetical protein